MTTFTTMSVSSSSSTSSFYITTYSSFSMISTSSFKSPSFPLLSPAHPPSPIRHLLGLHADYEKKYENEMSEEEMNHHLAIPFYTNKLINKFNRYVSVRGKTRLKSLKLNPGKSSGKVKNA